MISRKQYKAITRAYLKLDHGAGPDAMEGMCAELAAKMSLPVATVVSIFDACIKDTVYTGHVDIGRVIAAISDEYDNNGHDIAALATKYKFPPLELLVRIVAFKAGPKVGTKFRAGVGCSELGLAEHYGHARDVAESLDRNSRERMQMVQTMALDAEKKFEAWVVAQLPEGAKYKTEAQIRAQSDICAASPDVLFDDVTAISVICRGQTVAVSVRWIEYKSYFGTDAAYARRKTIRQIQRYEDRWGVGILCYELGFVAGMRVSHSMVACPDYSRGSMLVDVLSL